MKRRDLLSHLLAHGCVLLREGGSHSWWCHTSTNKRSAVPRHNEISNHLSVKICRDLGVPEPKKF
ncbi:MAG: type II toxin-antitoxin system HicA family toxin [Pseudomonadota bacterium]|nr:type II toxin-antitoxin system HicA family toxin [Pseudomonadota bacterium]